MNTHRSLLFVVPPLALLAAAWVGGWVFVTGEEGISPAVVADYVHTVIEADRAVYTHEVVQRLQNEEGVLKATERFREDRTLPLPAQMLRMGAQRAARSGSLHYSLLSPWAINRENLPRTELERRGLEAVVAHPDRPYTSVQTMEGVRYFLAVYADRAVSPACVQCHNGHPASPRRDFRVGDVMGGIVISLPLPD